MLIDSSLKPLGGVTSEPRKDAGKPGGARADTSGATAPASTAGAGVSLSPLSTKLQAIESSLTAAPAVDRGRVDAIRAAIAAGTFEIDTSRIADGLIESVQQMLDGRS